MGESLTRWIHLSSVLCVILLLPAHSHATPIKTMFNGTVHENLFDVSFEGSNGIAVGDRGLVVETEDGGGSWSRVPTPFTDLALFGVVRNNGKCLVVGQQGTVFRAPDCRTWEKVDIDSQGRLLEVDLNTRGVAYAVGGFGEIQQSLDGGESWQLVTLDWDTLTEGIEPHLYSVDVNDNDVVTISGEFELIIQSKDGGKTWDVRHKGEKSIFSMYFLASGEGYAVGQEGVMLKTVDDGVTWMQLSSPTRSILTGVWANTAGIVQVTGINTLLSSVDAGNSFQRSTKESLKGWFQAVTASNTLDVEGKVVVVGSGASIQSVELADSSDKIGE